MIECCTAPVGCRVTLRAIVAEVPCHMIRVCCLLELRRVALIAIRVMQLVVPVYVTRLARCCNVSTCQREKRRVMIECCTAPVGCRVALRAIVAEVPRYVVRVSCLLELRLMALVAIRVHQLVVPVGMTVLTLSCNMSPGQREPGSIMIERCVTPVGR
jgi:hypothetical protein